MTQGAVCVHCRRRVADAAWRPFCSERCKLLDLGTWLSNQYRVAGDPVAETDDDGEPHEAD